MTRYKPIKNAPPPANTRKGQDKTETPQLMKPFPYKKPGNKTDS